MSALTLETTAREIRPVGFGEASVGREMIRVAQEGQKQLSVLLGQWEMIITFFKHAMEVPLCINPKNQELQEQHRLMLTGAMSMGEMLLASTKTVDESELLKAGYSKDFLKANVRYLRDTYHQWYVERDQEAVERAYKEICHAFSGSSGKGVAA